MKKKTGFILTFIGSISMLLIFITCVFIGFYYGSYEVYQWYKGAFILLSFIIGFASLLGVGIIWYPYSMYGDRLEK